MGLVAPKNMNKETHEALKRYLEKVNELPDFWMTPEIMKDYRLIEDWMDEAKNDE